MASLPTPFALDKKKKKKKSYGISNLNVHASLTSLQMMHRGPPLPDL